MNHISNPKNRMPWAVASLLAVMAVTCVLSLRVKSPTVDEFAHLPAGYYYWKTGDFSLYAKNPPLIKLICSLPLLAMDVSIDRERGYEDAGDWRPWVYGAYFMRENAAGYDNIFFVGRLPVVLLGLLLGFYVFRWAYELYGFLGGVISLILYVFSPNIVAHSRLVTTDIGCACFMFMATYYLWRVLCLNRKKAWIGAGICSGLALLSKFTAFLLVPIFVLLFLLSALNGRKEGVNIRHLGKGLQRTALHFVLISVTAILIVNIGYGFTGSFETLKTIPHESEFFENLNRFPINRIPIPFPAAYMEGLDRQKLDAEQGVFLNYLRGRLSDDGWWYYFLYAFFVKTPIPLHVGIILSIFCALKWRREKVSSAFVLVPMAVIFIVFSFLNEINVGLRYILPLFPFLFVWLGQLAEIRQTKRLFHYSAVALLALYVFCSISIFPDYLAYFNAWAGGPEKGYRHLLDSNLDWGQDLKSLKGYMKEEGIKEIGLAYFGHVDPKIYGIDYHLIGKRPESGYIAISANYLYGLPYLITYGPKPIPIRPNTFEWLHAFEPNASIGHTIRVYSIPEERTRQDVRAEPLALRRKPCTTGIRFSTTFRNPNQRPLDLSPQTASSSWCG